MIHTEPRSGHLTRVLVLEIRSTRIGYVVFEGPTNLLNWGVLRKTHIPSRLGRQLSRLFLLSNPSLILISHNAKPESSYKFTIGAVHSKAKEICVSVLFIPRRV